MPQRIFGQIPNYPSGSVFDSRKALADAGLHRPLQAGISGSVSEGADSIVLSGGYEDDEDFGDIIIYTGEGGREQGKQSSNQELKRGNFALARNKAQGLPVRVIRGANHKSEHAPKSGYRYGGLYRVEDYWREKGKAGFYIWRFRLVKIEEDAPTFQKMLAEGEIPYSTPQRKETTSLRIVRDSNNVRIVKELYDYHCQVCDTRLETRVGPYAQAAHIQPLGRPHNGPDVVENLLCLCPNHHALFDLHGFAIADDFSLIGIEGKLRVHSGHKIGLEYVRYHREHYPVE